jgi:2,3-bisphosphoglycerate-independent phosphoglycerate mutase
MDKKILLLILDGFGISNKIEGNAVKNSNTPNIDYLYKNSYHTKLSASGEDVGLTEGKAGNSEVGHLNIGSGRIVEQYSLMIKNDIKDGSFFKNPTLISNISNNKGNIHIMGLLSDSDVHSNIDSIKAILESVKGNKVYFHIFSDGRDSCYKSVEKYLHMLDSYINSGKLVISSIIGRFYAMDRDNRWQRVEKAFELLVNHKGEEVVDIYEAINKSYNDGIYDEFIPPFYVKSTPKVESNDLLIFFNFREDRARELSSLFINSTKTNLLCMVNYTDDIKNYIYKRLNIENTLGDILSKNAVMQYRVAETEKYAHVTYFFDGGKDIVYKKEKRNIIPSLKVKTYDTVPFMRAREIIEKVEENMDKFDFIVANLANPDMVGHTGVYEATVKAIEFIDDNLKDLISLILDKNWTLILTADHGNSEEMITDGNINKSHTTNKVPFIFFNKDTLGNERELKEGILADIAPTILKFFDIKAPKEITGNTLL